MSSRPRRPACASASRRWLQTDVTDAPANPKQVYDLSMAFLIGYALTNGASSGGLVTHTMEGGRLRRLTPLARQWALSRRP